MNSVIQTIRAAKSFRANKKSSAARKGRGAFLFCDLTNRDFIVEEFDSARAKFNNDSCVWTCRFDQTDAKPSEPSGIS